MAEEDTHVLNKDLKQIFKIIQSCCEKLSSYSTQLKHAKHSECHQIQAIILNEEALYLWCMFGTEFVLQKKTAQRLRYSLCRTTLQNNETQPHLKTRFANNAGTIEMTGHDHNLT